MATIEQKEKKTPTAERVDKTKEKAGNMFTKAVLPGLGIISILTGGLAFGAMCLVVSANTDSEGKVKPAPKIEIKPGKGGGKKEDKKDEKK